MINTAITRARYSVVVVGDPVVLCSVGECKDIWRRYVELCFGKKSFFPESYSIEQLKAEVMIAEARLKSSSAVDEGLLNLAADAVQKMSGLL